MDICDFFEPVGAQGTLTSDEKHPLLLGRSLVQHNTETGFPDLEGIQIALIGVPEDRQSLTNQGCGLAPDYIRKYLYRLYRGPGQIRIADLGNIRTGDNIKDTYFALKTTLVHLIGKGITPVIIGGSQDLTFANYLAYKELGQVVNLVSVDARFDIGLEKPEVTNAQNYLSAILTHKPNYLFNFANIGYQTYFVDQDAIEMMEKLYFDAYRLGLVRSQMEETESVVRNADFVSVDISSIRQSDAPGNANASPHGFYGEEACQIMRYAGLSDKLSSIGFYETNPAFDHGEQTSHLVAQMIWYFLDGFASRKNDIPDKKRRESGDFIRYVVTIKDFQNEIVFYKSKISDRWWMEVPCPAGMQQKYERQYLVPCSYNDYLAACGDEIPEKWWQVYKKFI